MDRRVVVTGLGAVTPLGADLLSSWAGLVAGRDAVGPVDLFDTAGCRCHHAATVRQLPPVPELGTKALSRLSRATRLALPAAREALAMAGLLDDDGRCVHRELSVAVSTTAGGMGLGETFFRRALEGRRTHLLDQVARYLPQQQVLDLQQLLGFAGSSFIVANACASGANALGHGADLIRAGLADTVLTGGFEALAELVFVGFDCLQATSPGICRPFDLHRDGLLLGEGAAFLVLEAEETAARRGAIPLARLSGYGHTTDTFHLTQPEPTGAALVAVMRAAAGEAGIAPGELAYINAHGTATPVNDGPEARAYLDFLGGTTGAVRISSTKAAIGHTLGAAGAVEALAALQVLRTGQVPPQLNLREPMPEIAPLLARPDDIAPTAAHVMSVNLGFGGSNAALIFSAP